MKIIAQMLVYNEAHYVEKAILPWVNVCERIDVFEGSFQTLRGLGYSPRSTDGTCDILNKMSDSYNNVKVYFENYYNEPILRNHHLFSTIRDFGRNETVLFILDGDEIYSDEEVDRCINQVALGLDKYNTFWVNMKNYINDEKTSYDGFRVPRFFNLEKAIGFVGYNNVAFEGGVKEIDMGGVCPKHYSWVGLEKCKQKIKWQNSLGWECSFKIENEEVVLNDSYYQNTGKIKPVLSHE
jgi:hypothetical protein